MRRSTRLNVKSTPPTPPTPKLPTPNSGKSSKPSLVTTPPEMASPLKKSPIPDPEKSSKSPLLTIPPEIRNHIYTLLLVSDGPQQPRVDRLFKSTESQERSTRPFLSLPHEKTLALARTCSQLHDESISVFFGRNTFKFRDTYDLYVYLYMIGSQRRSCLKIVEFHFHGVQQTQAFELLGECFGLKRLKLIISKQTMKGAKQPQEDLWTARGVSALRRIKGMKILEIEITRKTHWIDEAGSFRCWFEKEHVKEFARVLQKEMREDKVLNEEELEKEKKRLERKTKEERKSEQERARAAKDFFEFEKKREQRLEKEKEKVLKNFTAKPQ